MRKQYILYIVVILSSLISIINTNNTSALSYQSSVGVGFTFNPTLSVSISPSDLVISNLVPGNALDSNVINVSVASNAAYGYTLSAIMNGDNNDLTHINGTNTFSSIATNADLSSLDNSEDTNIWGYSTSLDSGATWSNYNGLSSSNSTILLDTNSNNSNVEANGIDSIDFKIGAKAASTQASGTYAGTINFTAITKHIPVTLAEAYASEGKTMTNGFYTMQDMTSTICNKVEAIGAQLQVLDKRDNKLYWISKLADNHCWMTQNLDLDLSHDRPLTSENTDLNDSSLSGAYSENYTYNSTTKIITWTPTNTTYNLDNKIGTTWTNNNNVAYSFDPGISYPDDTVTKESSGTHGLAGNLYNWSAAIASDNSISLNLDQINNPQNNPQNSICPKGWRLPTISSASSATINSNNEFARLNNLYNNDASSGYDNLIDYPLFFLRAGYINGGNWHSGKSAGYLSSTTKSDEVSYYLYFGNNGNVRVRHTQIRYTGVSVRCLAR